ncbi:HEAT repeat domain-containing protein [Nocardioides marmotae]|uniref:Uncharacterized protein n=1 Tax=Nocardioides marmotae TaxID=2663857 RepID=A0A6I3J6E9_9ACTN|nr:HEAT repeat domain-containing protein [Nocardioides marmotae]MCR6031455.1 hypothetical protein [Gordonia jinghuaiqii]MBC9733389.1 HEAT repeat domain-containing protein [Nocardioides marmotae]MTB84496.1 hypothetical protein [Nocardioides marmotae]MTB95094.1 hypothetical protein [Nocardioides marmotae]QKE02414.1 HEAT repeat domain-containing protein [Nocardioides marmotae]
MPGTESHENPQAQAAAILEELRIAGYDVDSVYSLRERYRDYRDAVPILAGWLPRVRDMDLKEGLLRSLAVRFAQAALPALIEDFTRMDTSVDPTGFQLRWAAGNSIEVLWDDRCFDDLVALATDRAYGRGREMVVRGLGRSKRAEAADVLIGLLDDPDVLVPAVIALRKHPDPRARGPLEKAHAGQERWVQKEIEKTLATLPS